MIVYLNGHFLPEEKALISVFDRGFLYGDGLFETIRVRRGRAFLWEKHLERFKRGAEALQISLPESGVLLRNKTSDLLSLNNASECLLRITLSRGAGVRGYSPRGANTPTLMLSLHPLSERWETLHQWRLIVSSLRAADPVAQHKTSNKLVQVLARAEADEAGADDAILLRVDGRVAETSSSNIFWIKAGTVHTCPSDGGLLPGITRETVLHLCRESGAPVVEASGTLDDLLHADGVFLTQTSLGIVEVAHLGDKELHRSNLVPDLHAAYHKFLDQATALKSS